MASKNAQVPGAARPLLVHPSRVLDRHFLNGCRTRPARHNTEMMTSVWARCHRIVVCRRSRYRGCQLPRSMPGACHTLHLQRVSGEKTHALLFPFSIESLAILPSLPRRLRHGLPYRHGPTAFLLFSFASCVSWLLSTQLPEESSAIPKPHSHLL